MRFFVFDQQNRSTEIDTNKSGICYRNPLRWKGHYYDRETRLYYIQGRYYDPETGRMITSHSCDEITSNPQESIYALLDNNPLSFIPNCANIYPSLPVVFDGEVSFKWIRDLLHWYNKLHWGWKVGVGTGLFLAGLGLTMLSGGAALPFIINFGIGVTAGTAIGTGINLAMGASFGDALLGGFADSVLWSGVFSFASASVNAIRRIPAYKFLRSQGLEHAQVRSTLRAFKGIPKVTTLQADTTVYRSWGDGARMLSHWVSPNNYGDAARSLLSIPAANSMEFTSTFLIQSGTQVLAGTAAPMFGQIGGGIQWWLALLTL